MNLSFHKEFAMSRFNLALSSFFVFLGISLLILAALVAPQNAFGDTACETNCYASTCSGPCKNPGSPECAACKKYCQDMCAKQNQIVCLGGNFSCDFACTKSPGAKQGVCRLFESVVVEGGGVVQAPTCRNFPPPCIFCQCTPSNPADTCDCD